MASGGFPQRKSSGSGAMGDPGGSGSVLDGAPPSPAMPPDGGQMTPGVAPQMPSMAQMAQPLTIGTPDRATSPEVAQGMLSTAATVYSIFDSMASLAPDLANDFVLMKDQLQRTMAKLLLKGGSSAPSTSTGVNFPGGGFSSGAM